ncbi:ArsR/SmtB family transcription factor [Streptomyces prasinopilosus]|uniref:Helix-turn-helix domain-containing protein n=1 Tax=Streptomyces prasinopilosus TaxID=67344 RepID=A0A1G6Z1M5_9ACTN|nr:winged helix-turn-helix domain-containing protein [Streptomyces prasinopilosus]SDD96432.1 Helix-turn-helix domain-containing protein [Streptomyces prasinopilosus]
MNLEERVADLERRLAALETAGAAGAARHDAPHPGEGDFWALEGLRNQLTELKAADGGVLFTGAVRLPTGERYEWQHGALTAGLLDEDWPAAAEPLAALGHPVRLRLLREILGGRRTAAELAELDGVGTTGQIYHHLRQLTGAGWLHTTGRGRHEVPAGRVVPLLVLLSAALT